MPKAKGPSELKAVAWMVEYKEGAPDTGPWTRLAEAHTDKAEACGHLSRLRFSRCCRNVTGPIPLVTLESAQAAIEAAKGGKATKCPICGEMALEDRRGEFRFDPPPNIPGGVIIIPDARWQECVACGEQILGLKLEASLEEAAVNGWRRKASHDNR